MVITQVPSRSITLSLKSDRRSVNSEAFDVLSFTASTSTKRGGSENVDNLRKDREV